MSMYHYFNLIVKSRLNPSLEPTSTKQLDKSPKMISAIELRSR